VSGVNIAAATALIAAIGYLAAVWIYRVAQARQQIRARLPKPCPWPVDDHRPAQRHPGLEKEHAVAAARNLAGGQGVAPTAATKKVTFRTHHREASK
jgi:hypothetical protein